MAALGAAALSLAAGCAGRGPAADATSSTLALVGGTVWTAPDEEPLPDAVVLVEGGTIVAVGPRGSVPVPPAAERIDCAGDTVTAGFWNSHVHFFEEAWSDAATIPAADLERMLQDMLTRYGFTTAFDIGSPWENTTSLRGRIESGEVRGPRLLTTGEPLLAPGALPPASVLRELGYMPLSAHEVVSGPEAATAARALLARGADGVKVHLQPPPPSRPSLSAAGIEAAVREAHARGKPVFVHPANASDVLVAVRSGVDVVAHTTPASGAWDDELLAAMQAADVALTPTLALWGSPVAIEQLRAWAERGGEVLFGNDLGAVARDPTDEYTAMAAAGLDLPALLATLTTAPARRFGEAERRGSLSPGRAADLVVLRGEPPAFDGAGDSADPGDGRALALAAFLTGVRVTVRAGRVVFAAD